jgi:hypothetical protein
MADLPNIINEQLPPVPPALRDEVVNQIEGAAQPLLSEMDKRTQEAIDLFSEQGKEFSYWGTSPLETAVRDMYFFVQGDIRQMQNYVRLRGSLVGALLTTRRLASNRDWTFANVDELLKEARSKRRRELEGESTE